MNKSSTTNHTRWLKCLQLKIETFYFIGRMRKVERKDTKCCGKQKCLLVSNSENRMRMIDYSKVNGKLLENAFAICRIRPVQVLRYICSGGDVGKNLQRS